jgi:hypothetical protein
MKNLVEGAAIDLPLVRSLRALGHRVTAINTHASSEAIDRDRRRLLSAAAMGIVATDDRLRADGLSGGSCGLDLRLQ